VVELLPCPTDTIQPRGALSCAAPWFVLLHRPVLYCATTRHAMYVAALHRPALSCFRGWGFLDTVYCSALSLQQAITTTRS
jgi:hypothetical protein